MVKLKFKAVFLDFYGTLVHEDEVYIEEICQRILESAANQTTAKDIGKYWWQSFSRKFQSSYGENFKTQRQLELSSLEDTAAFYRSSVNPIELCEILYGHWQSAQLFDDAKLFLTKVKTPPIILSNIDRKDIQAAIKHNGLSFQNIITSEDVRSYKPRPEMFQRALMEHGLNPAEVLHVGDSLISDVSGAQQAGIKVAWINRNHKPLPPNCSPDYIVKSLEELLPILA